ncbi:MAG: type I glyceraldehyde-3-phosphate dehydrogenase [Candidatus Puniceispirillum sp.]|uniref:type I glyceraldehyde-3-phosphate dehydrogenase n=1 Tax=Candidatus Puniceispirillum sp. TaxID=2026719 RepID=UPI001EC1F1C7|nr:type I glyceraldehyde-3-phosphate dehydrogenase [Candidatus Puniceispirillum sp.]MBT6414620.1 type I glyceraldehyde-3-phosphate dehydrogenase [Candidatus Puniceispirillum sp.]MBT6565781.1 type I glyceraldehyde-3-phosphate dehydrogenase [Candidatus Puniceispirillum sp.]
MTLRLAISGFGRIGRMTLRALQESARNDIEVVLINSPGPVETSAHLYEYDSVHGRSKTGVSYGDDWLDIGRGKIHMTRHRNPADIPHKELDIDVVLECSGKFNDRDKSSLHLDAGAKKILISAPCRTADQTIVYGVNHDQLRSDSVILSNASCTTNGLAPVAKILSDGLGIEAGYMTTIHAYTGDQAVLDASHKDLRRARAAGLSMIPTSTGATSAVGEVLPELKGKMNGSAIRVPTANVSVIDLTIMSSRDTSTEEVNDLLKTAANGSMKGVLGINERPLVSVDFNHDPHSSIADLEQTSVLNNRLVRVLAWYDNEWGFSCRMLDNAALIGNTLS